MGVTLSAIGMIVGYPVRLNSIGGGPVQLGLFNWGRT